MPATDADNGTAATAAATATPTPTDMAATAPATETTGKEPETSLPMSTTKPPASPTKTPKKTNEGAVAETTKNVTTENLVESTRTNTPSIPATVTPHKESDVLTHQTNLKAGDAYDIATRKTFLLDTNKNDTLNPSVSTLGAVVKLYNVDGQVCPLALAGGNQATPDKTKMRNIQDSFTNDKSDESYHSMKDDNLILMLIDNVSFGDEADEKHVSNFCGKKFCHTG